MYVKLKHIPRTELKTPSRFDHVHTRGDSKRTSKAVNSVTTVLWLWKGSEVRLVAKYGNNVRMSSWELHHAIPHRKLV